SWLPGENPDLGSGDPELALDLARLTRALREIDTMGAPASRRGRPLATQDERARQALFEVPEAKGAWEAALGVPDWDGPPVWLHADLLPGNLLVRAGRLAGVIDFAVAGVGDPACDLIRRGRCWAATRGTSFAARPGSTTTHGPAGAGGRFRSA